MRTLLPVLLLAALLPAQEPPHPATTLALDDHIEWIDCGATFLDGRRVKRSLTEEEDAVDRSALIDRAVAKGAEAGRPVLWYVPRIIESGLRGRQMYRAPILDIYTRQVLFADPDVAAITTHRFVPVRCVCDEALSERFDLRPLDFVEPAIVFLDGEGEVIHHVSKVRTFDGLWFADLLRRVLEAGGYEAPDEGTPGERIARGDWEGALAALARVEEPGVAGTVAHAGLLRRLRRPEEAHDKLDRAAGQIAGLEAGLAAMRDELRRERSREAYAAYRERSAEVERVRAPFDLERGRLLLMEGRLLEARTPLERAWRAGRPEGGYLEALCRLRLGDEVGALQRFQLVARRHPDSLWGRRAEANCTLGRDERPMGAAFAGFEHFGYLPDAAHAGLPADTSWAGDPQQPEKLAEHAVRFLLEQQRDDGGWTDARYAYWPDSEITPNTWVAITALCCAALLEHRRVDPAAIDEALARGEAYLLDAKHLNRGANEDSYSDAFRLVYLARKARRSGDAAARRAVAHMEEIVAAARLRQANDGFFAHEYKNAFATGAVLWGLLCARDAGAAVPEETISRGLSALVSARHEDGSYAYSGTAANRTSTLKDSAARMPLCEAVLLRAERGGARALHFAIENYWEHMDRMERVRRNDFHSDGELAGFFFFHGMFHTSEALRLLPGELRAETSERFLETLREIPEMDGSFVDSHEFGRSYATAMALLTLDNCTDPQ